MVKLKVFLSTSTHVTEKQKKDIYDFVLHVVKNQYEDMIYNTDQIEIISNIDEPPAPNDILYPKLYYLSKALDKMKDCDIFFLLKEEDGSIKPGCYIELNAWLSANGVEPIIRTKINEK